MISTDTECPVQEGDILAGKYRVEKIIGIGGMGVVVAAEHIHLSQRVAVKFLLPNACKNADAVGRFLREARAAVRIQSEHVARVIDVGTLDDSAAPYMVLEFLQGEDLSDVLRKRGRLPVSDAVNYVLQACEAIAEAHSLGIIHRDLKPANLFLTKRADGSSLVKVLDFGISKASILDPSDEPSHALTATGSVMGSPLYMSPEQIRDSKHVDVRTDIWALGAVLFELVAGRNVYQADTLPSLIAMIISESPPLLRDICTDIPDGFSAIVEKCLQKPVEDRFNTVGDLALALLPHAPRSSRLSVERIVNVIGGKGELPASIAPPVLSPVPSAAAPSPQTATVPAWGTTMKNAPKKSRGLLVAVTVLGVGAMAASVFAVSRARPSANSPPESVVSPSAESAKPEPLVSAPVVASAPVASASVASAPPAVSTAVTLAETGARPAARAAKDKPNAKQPAEKPSKAAVPSPVPTHDILADP